MAVRNRNFREIIMYGTEFEAFCSAIRQVANNMSADAAAANGILKDTMSKKRIREIEECAQALRTAVEKGEGPVHEMVMQARRSQKRLEELER